MQFNKRLLSFKYALQGIYALFRHETNAQIHLIATVCIIGAGFYFSIESYEWIAILICIGLVIGFEALNTAIEKLTDLVSPDYHPLAGLTKDIAAGAVLIASLIAVVIASIIFWPKIGQIF
jgi:diacylglycerol kinase (ATP)